jgi:sRNA-binding protein
MMPLKEEPSALASAGPLECASTPPAHSLNSQDQSIEQTLSALAELFPFAFTAENWKPHWSLKIGIHKDLIERGLLSPDECRIVLRWYCARLMYRRAIAAGGVRLDLDGDVAGEVTPDESAHAKEAVAGGEAKRRAAAAKAAADKRRAAAAGKPARKPNDKPPHHLRPPEQPTPPSSQSRKLSSLADLKAAYAARRAGAPPSHAPLQRKPIMDNLFASSVVADFERVSIATGLSCPSCGSAFSPHSMRFDGSTVILRCDACHVDAVACKLCLPNGEDSESLHFGI